VDGRGRGDADATIQSAQSKSITADATIGASALHLVSPADGVNMSTLPVLVFIMPDACEHALPHAARHGGHVRQRDLREFKTNHDLTAGSITTG